MKLFLRLSSAALLAASLMQADVTYSQTTKFEGGTMVDMMKKMADMPMLGRIAGGGAMRQAFEDQHYQVYIKGNKMARWGKTTSLLYDLDAGTITTIDNTRKTYRTTTFAEMQQRMEQMQQRMNRGETGALDFDVKVSSTGETRDIDGVTAKGTLIVMTAKQPTQQGKMVVTTHAWLVPYTAASKEALEFQRKLAGQYASAFGSGGPGMGAASSGMAAAIKEAMKLDGCPALMETEITGVSAGFPMGNDENADPNAPLIKTQTEYGQFTQAAVDDSKFAIPDGYKEAKEPNRARFGARPEH